MPTIAFVLATFLVIAVGLLRAHPAAALSRTLPQATDTAGVLLVLRSFASGCSALTGVEAIHGWQDMGMGYHAGPGR